LELCKGTAIGILVLKPRLATGSNISGQEDTGGQAIAVEIPIDALHAQIFADLTTGALSEPKP
jgi:hypothetical protein